MATTKKKNTTTANKSTTTKKATITKKKVEKTVEETNVVDEFIDNMVGKTLTDDDIIKPNIEDKKDIEDINVSETMQEDIQDIVDSVLTDNNNAELIKPELINEDELQKVLNDVGQPEDITPEDITPEDITPKDVTPKPIDNSLPIRYVNTHMGIKYDE